MNNRKILIVDDDAALRKALRVALECFDLGYQIDEAICGIEAVTRITAEPPSLVLLDIMLPDMSGLSVLKQVKKYPRLIVVMITGQGTADTAIESMKYGAFDYITKPFNLPLLEDVVKRALSASQLMEEKVEIGETPRVEDVAALQMLLGKTMVMQEIYKTIGLASGNDSPVLLTGETASGKELVVRAIYQHSRRSANQFMSIDCAAVADAMLESELFGRERLSAKSTEKRIGKLEQCTGGTVFLKKIDKMSSWMQAKVIRVLKENKIERLGGTTPISIDTRFICSVNRDASDKKAEIGVLEDFLRHSNVIEINMPPLRDRRDDIPLLVDHFLKKYNFAFKKYVVEIPLDAMTLLKNYSWPGNVAELENMIRTAVADSTGSILQINSDNLAKFGGTGSKPVRHESLSDYNAWMETAEATIDILINKARYLEKEPGKQGLLPEMEALIIRKTMQLFEGNISKTAELLGISQTSLQIKLKTIGLGPIKESS